MTPRCLTVALSLVVLAAASALAQTSPNGGAYPPNGSNANGSSPYPANNGAAAPASPSAPTPNDLNGVPGGSPSPAAQALQPQTPSLTPRGAAPAAAAQKQPEPPFTLTAQEQADVDKVLDGWEQYNKKVKKFEAEFKRWTYDSVFGKPDVPKNVDLGRVIYATPDRGRYEVDKTETAGAITAIPVNRQETWICDGDSIFEYNFQTKKIIDHRLPPSQRGKAIANGPLPFLFGAEAKMLKQRYYIRLITPPNGQGQQYCLEAYPRFQAEKANFDHAYFIINAKDSTPFALKLVESNQNSVVFQFYNVGVNIPPGLFAGNPFRPWLPSLMWQKVVDDSQLSQSPKPNDMRR